MLSLVFVHNFQLKEIKCDACCDSNERAPRTVINRTEIQNRQSSKLSKSPMVRENPCREDQVWVCVEAPDQLSDSDLLSRLGETIEK